MRDDIQAALTSARRRTGNFALFVLRTSLDSEFYQVVEMAYNFSGYNHCERELSGALDADECVKFLNDMAPDVHA